MKYRMYHLVMYNISPIQQGIQAYHAGMEYAKRYWNDKNFLQWIHEDNTVIILNGGTSNNSPDMEKGTMEKFLEELENNNIDCACFIEPDLNNSTSAIAFLVPEEVWNKEDYPEFTCFNLSYEEKYKLSPEHETICEIEYDKWVYLVGGKQNVWLRQFLSQFKLA